MPGSALRIRAPPRPLQAAHLRSPCSGGGRAQVRPSATFLPSPPSGRPRGSGGALSRGVGVGVSVGRVQAGREAQGGKSGGQGLGGPGEGRGSVPGCRGGVPSPVSKLANQNMPLGAGTSLEDSDTPEEEDQGYTTGGVPRDVGMCSQRRVLSSGRHTELRGPLEAQRHTHTDSRVKRVPRTSQRKGTG